MLCLFPFFIRETYCLVPTHDLINVPVNVDRLFYNVYFRRKREQIDYVICGLISIMT